MRRYGSDVRLYGRRDGGGQRAGPREVTGQCAQLLDLAERATDRRRRVLLDNLDPDAAQLLLNGIGVIGDDHEVRPGRRVRRGLRANTDDRLDTRIESGD